MAERQDLLRIKKYSTRCKLRRVCVPLELRARLLDSRDERNVHGRLSLQPLIFELRWGHISGFEYISIYCAKSTPQFEAKRGSLLYEIPVNFWIQKRRLPGWFSLILLKNVEYPQKLEKPEKPLLL